VLPPCSTLRLSDESTPVKVAHNVLRCNIGVAVWPVGVTALGRR